MFVVPPQPYGEMWVGSVTTGAPGSPVSVINSGTPWVAVLDISIPQGSPGSKGDPGNTGTGATVAIGTVTTGAAGSSASVTNVGTSSAAILNVTIPRGNAGTSPSYYATRVTTNAAGLYTWTYPSAMPSVPAISATVQSATTDIFDVRITAVTTTSCTVQLGRTQAVAVAPLGLTILSVPASVGAQTVHLTASV